ncbi:YceI family protein [Uniformispora flossi]|uniref:YceI family protein n=1 Tax=Uniformispora flossi TaxID=3390723 RepID=UPI003C2AC0E0
MFNRFHVQATCLGVSTTARAAQAAASPCWSHVVNFVPSTVPIPGYVVGAWQAELSNSEVAFSLRQLVTKLRGRFTRFNATIVTRENPDDSSVAVTLDLASVDTGNAKRDEHLRSADFFEVDQHPSVTYNSTGVRHTDGGWVVDGVLTLHGVARQVPLTVVVNGFSVDSAGTSRARFSATAEIKRSEFGIGRWTGAVASDKVTIELELEAVLLERNEGESAAGYRG